MAEEGASGYRRRPSESERRLARRHNVARADCMDGGLMEAGPGRCRNQGDAPVTPLRHLVFGGK